MSLLNVEETVAVLFLQSIVLKALVGGTYVLVQGQFKWTQQPDKKK